MNKASRVPHVLLEVLMLGKRNETPWEFQRPENVLTGDDGSFLITCVIPGISYRVDGPKTNLRAGQSKEGYLKAKRWSLKPGESVSWSDVRVSSWDR